VVAGDAGRRACGHRIAAVNAKTRIGQAVRRATRSVSAERAAHEERRLRDLYLDLLERAVMHTLYSPPDVREDPARVVDLFEAEFERVGIKEFPAEDWLSATEKREQGRDWPIYAQTMVGAKRVRNVRESVETVLADGIPGDLIEAGCWRGGSSILMRGVLKAYGVTDRVVFAADSFEGLPKPDAERFPADARDTGYQAEELKIPLRQVRNNFERYKLYDDRVRLVKGWFSETLPTLRDRRWALIRLDGDLYESTMDGLVNLYPQLSPGGIVIIDDYGWVNCREAVEAYRDEHSIDEPIVEIDWAGAFWRKRL
jgi:O-methyltransferase